MCQSYYISSSNMYQVINCLSLRYTEVNKCLSPRKRVLVSTLRTMYLSINCNVTDINSLTEEICLQKNTYTSMFCPFIGVKIQISSQILCQLISTDMFHYLCRHVTQHNLNITMSNTLLNIKKKPMQQFLTTVLITQL